MVNGKKLPQSNARRQDTSSYVALVPLKLMNSCIEMPLDSIGHIITKKEEENDGKVETKLPILPIIEQIKS